jgi:hypothetical protein
MLRSTRRPDPCRPIVARSQIAANKAIAGRSVGALAVPKLIAVFGVTKPITAKATASSFRARASRFPFAS